MTIATNKLLILAASGLLVTFGAPSSARADEGDDDDVEGDDGVDCHDHGHAGDGWGHDGVDDRRHPDDAAQGCPVAPAPGGVGGLLLGLGLAGWHVRPRRRR